MKSPKDDNINRRPVWKVLSELFLDTELQPSDHEGIAKTLRESPYTIEEIEYILFHEVYPLCIWNMRHPAGEWIGFDLEWLEKNILKRASQKFKLPVVLQTGHWMIRADWEKIKSLIEK